MTDSEYRNTQNCLIHVGRLIEQLDLNAFRGRISAAQSVGPILDPTLYRAAGRNLQAIDELAAAGVNLKSAFQALKSQVETETQSMGNDDIRQCGPA